MVAEEVAIISRPVARLVGLCHVDLQQMIVRVMQRPDRHGSYLLQLRRPRRFSGVETPLTIPSIFQQEHLGSLRLR